MSYMEKETNYKYIQNDTEEYYNYITFLIDLIDIEVTQIKYKEMPDFQEYIFKLVYNIKFIMIFITSQFNKYHNEYYDQIIEDLKGAINILNEHDRYHRLRYGLGGGGNIIIGGIKMSSDINKLKLIRSEMPVFNNKAIYNDYKHIERLNDFLTSQYIPLLNSFLNNWKRKYNLASVINTTYEDIKNFLTNPNKRIKQYNDNNPLLKNKLANTLNKLSSRRNLLAPPVNAPAFIHSSSFSKAYPMHVGGKSRKYKK